MQSFVYDLLLATVKFIHFHLNDPEISGEIFCSMTVALGVL